MNDCTKDAQRIAKDAIAHLKQAKQAAEKREFRQHQLAVLFFGIDLAIVTLEDLVSEQAEDEENKP